MKKQTSYTILHENHEIETNFRDKNDLVAIVTKLDTILGTK